MQEIQFVYKRKMCHSSPTLVFVNNSIPGASDSVLTISFPLCSSQRPTIHCLINCTAWTQWMSWLVYVLLYLYREYDNTVLHVTTWVFMVGWAGYLWDNNYKRYTKYTLYSVFNNYTIQRKNKRRKSLSIKDTYNYLMNY